MSASLRPNLDPLNFRDALAAIGLTRLVTDLSGGATVWTLEHGTPVFEILLDLEAEDFAARCAAWSAEHGSAFDDGGKLDVKNVDPETWRTFADVEDELQSNYWAAVGSDGVPHDKGRQADWSRIAASQLEYAQGGGGGKSNWLGSMAAFMGQGADRYAGGRGGSGVRLGDLDFHRVLQGKVIGTCSVSEAESVREPASNVAVEPLTICRWDAATEREHATQSTKPAGDPLLQDQTVNALAAIGLTSCPSGPTQRGLSTPMVTGAGKGEVDLAWPLWTTPLRLAALEAALVLGEASWRGWPVVQGRRYYPGKVPVFPRGVLELPVADLLERS